MAHFCAIAQPSQGQVNISDLMVASFSTRLMRAHAQTQCAINICQL